jgi:hypothetical protein
VCLILGSIGNAQNPGGVSGAKLWFKADTSAKLVNGNQVQQWNDQSNSGEVITQATVVGGLPGNDVIFTNNTINFRPAVSFTGSLGVYLRGLTNSAFNTPATIFIVSRLGQLPTPTSETLLGLFTTRTNATSGGGGGQGISCGGVSQHYYLMDGNGAQAANSATINISSGELALVYGIYNDGASTNNTMISKNGVSNGFTGTGATITANCSEFEIGGRSFNNQQDRVFEGEIAEIIYYARVLSTVEIDRVETYLALKYGITLGTSLLPVNYTVLGVADLWDADPSYHHLIFGIGRADSSGLLVTQSNSMESGSGDGTGIPGRGNIVLSSPSPFDDLDFILIGNDSVDLIPETAAELPPDPAFNGTLRVGREWKVKNTNYVGTVNLSFDTHGLPLSGDMDNIALLISEGDNDFSTGIYRVYKAPLINDSVLTYESIILNDDDHFTFVTNLTDPLPTELVRFTVMHCGDNNCLQWQTASENNNDRFEIQRSANALDFLTIGTVMGNGNSTVLQNYSFADNVVLNGKNYYRLKQVDRDGHFHYSAIVVIENRIAGNEISIVPNPARGNFTLRTTQQFPGEFMLLRFYDTYGKEVHNQRCSWDRTVSVQLPKGLYIAMVTIRGITYRSKVLIL